LLQQRHGAGGIAVITRNIAHAVQHGRGVVVITKLLISGQRCFKQRHTSRIGANSPDTEPLGKEHQGDAGSITCLVEEGQGLVVDCEQTRPRFSLQHAPIERA
jgi:hypothetical protein